MILTKGERQEVRGMIIRSICVLIAFGTIFSIAFYTTPTFCPQAIVLVSTGGDMTAAMQAAYDTASAGDTIVLRPANGKPFIISSNINWAKGTPVNIEATGATLYAAMALSGTQAMITWGAPPGQRGGNCSWRGGNIVGSLAVQNLSYSTIEPMKCCTLILQCDTVCSYNIIRVPGGLDGGAGNGSAVIFNQLAPGAWSNRVTFRDTPMHGNWVGSSTNPPQPVIWQANPAAQYGPGPTIFDACSFEGDGQTLLNCGPRTSCIFDSCYAEGDWTQGTGGGVEAFTWVNMPAKWAAWLSDPRNIATGIMQ